MSAKRNFHDPQDKQFIAFLYQGSSGDPQNTGDSLSAPSLHFPTYGTWPAPF